MQKKSFNSISVRSTETITPNMQRIVFHGEALKQFPDECEGGYIKLLFNQAGGTDLAELGDSRPAMRTYTIRRFMKNEQAIEVDFVRHITEDLQCGFAARWAMNAQVGDNIGVAGPGNISDLNLEADWFFLTADMTALPALSVKIRQLPKDAQGYAIIKVESEADIQEIEAPSGINVQWITGDLAQATRQQTWLEGNAAVWCACEFDSMRALRQYFRNDKQVERENIYISSYWKQGVSEDGHKIIKHQDAEENE